MSSFVQPDAELPRDRWGRPLIAPADGGKPEAYQRVSTFAHVIDDASGLTKWKLRMAVQGLGARKDLQFAASTVDPESQYAFREYMKIADRAIDAAGGSSAAEIGTAIHGWIEKLNEGTLDWDRVPDEYHADLKAFQDAFEGFEVLAAEQFVVIDELKVGGSFDLLVRVPAGITAPDGTDLGGQVVIADVKTSRTLEYGLAGFGIQMACYAHGKLYDHTDGSRQSLPGGPSTKWGIVFHVQVGKGTCDVVVVDLEQPWETAVSVIPLVKAFRGLKPKDIAKTARTGRAEVGAVEGGGADSIVAQMRAATSAEALRAIYRANADRWTPGLTELAKELKEGLAA